MRRDVGSLDAASHSRDKATQDVLSSIIDAIEAPAIARGELARDD